MSTVGEVASFFVTPPSVDMVLPEIFVPKINWSMCTRYKVEYTYVTTCKSINNSIGYTQFDKIRFWVSFEVT